MAKQQDQKTFEKGLFPQFGALELPAGTYLDALNMSRDEDGSIGKEFGSAALSTKTLIHNAVQVVHNGEEVVLGYDQFLTGAIIVGQYVFGDILYYAVADIASGEAKGILKLAKDGTLSVEINSDFVGIFSTDSRVRMEGKVDYTGDVILYLAGKNVILSRVNITANKVYDLFEQYTLPVVNDINEDSGGSLLTGNYQFFVRYVTVSGEKTTVSVPSFWYPVIPTKIHNTTKLADVEGAPPQTATAKRLSIDIVDIDIAFPKIEVLVATYVGTENVLEANSIGEFTIEGSTKTVTFSGDDDYTNTVLLSELNLSSVSYKSAETITQKDSTLILGNLTAKDSVEFNWQTEFANKIKIQPKISPLKNRVFDPQATRTHDGVDTEFYNLPDYKTDAATGYNTEYNVTEDNTPISGYAIPKNNKYKGYRFDEIYSFAIVPIFKDGSEGDAYHVPGLPVNLAGDGRQVIPTDTYAECDVAVYGDEFGAVLEGLPVSYHKMGGILADPSINVALDVDTSETGNTWEEFAVGFKIVREDRKGKETILGEGTAASLLKNRAQNSERILPYGLGEVMHGIVPAFYSGILVDAEDTYTTHNWLGGNVQVDPYPPTGPLTDCYDERLLSLFMPDFLQDILNPSDISFIRETGTFLAPMVYASTINAFVRPAIRGVYKYSGMYGLSVGNKVGVDSFETLLSNGSFGEQRTDSAEVIKLQKTLTIFGDTNLVTSGRPKTLIVKTEEDVPTEVIPGTDLRCYGTFYGTPSSNRGLVASFGGAMDSIPLWTANIYKRFRLERERPDFYGEVKNKEYQFVAYIKSGSDDIVEVYGGDTYTSVYSMTVPFYGKLDISESAGIYNEPWGSTTLLMPVQSYNNYFFRHEVDSNEENGVDGSPSYPTTKQLETELFGLDDSAGELGITNIAAGLGQNEQFNTSYSANNALRTSFLKNFDIAEVLQLPNRAIYSNVQSADSVIDSYGIFLSDNYHDIPKDSGEITALNTVGNDLYISTERKLWRAFYNALATQATSEGDIVLGNGGAFNRPSVPVVDVNGGYIGSPSQEATVVSPAGMYVYDTNRHKMFYIGTNGLQEITNPGMFNFLKEILPTDPRLGYDYKSKRVMLSSPEVTLSFHPELNSFTSRHSYQFGYLSSLGVKTLMVKSESALINEFVDDRTQEYFGEPFKATIRTSSIVHPAISKRFVGIDAVVVATDLPSGNNLPHLFFDFMSAYSHERHTGKSVLSVISGYNSVLESLGVVFAHKANNKYRMTIPADVVYNINNNIFDENNWVTNTHNFDDSDRVFRPDMTDNHLVVELEISPDKASSSMSLSSLIINFVKNNT